MNFEIKYKELTEYLKGLKEKDFERSWNKNPNCAIKEGHSILDIEYFKMDKSKITLDTVINLGTPFLVDAIGNDLSILILTKRKYKLPTGRLVNAKFHKTLISDCRKLYGTPLNGLWVIPNQFLTSN